MRAAANEGEPPNGEGVTASRSEESDESNFHGCPLVLFVFFLTGLLISKLTKLL